MRFLIALLLFLCGLDCNAQILSGRRNVRLLASASGGCVTTTNALTFNSLATLTTTAASNSYAAPAFTPTTNATLIFFIAGTPNGSWTVTNTGTTQLTWWEAKTTNYNTLGTPTASLSVWVSQLASGTAPFSMQVVATKASGTGINLSVVEVIGADQTLAFGTNAIAQISQTGSNATANPKLSWSAPGNAGLNSIIYGLADDINSAADNAAATDWTELTETAFNTPATGLTVDYKTFVPAGTTSTTNTVTSRDWAAVILEVKAGTKCTSAGGGACSDDATPSQSVKSTEGGGTTLGETTDRYYVGLSGWSDASARTICKLRFKLSLGAGSITGKTYKAAIYTMSGLNLDTLVGSASTGVTGNNSWSETDVIFTMPDVVLSASTSYAFVCYMDGTADASNYARFEYDDVSSLVPGKMAWWNTVFAQDGDVPAGEPSIGIYFKE